LQLFIHGTGDGLELCFHNEKGFVHKDKHRIIGQELLGNQLAVIYALGGQKLGIKLVFLVKERDILSLECHAVILHRIAGQGGNDRGNVRPLLEMEPVLLGGSAARASANHEGISPIYIKRLMDREKRKEDAWVWRLAGKNRKLGKRTI